MLRDREWVEREARRTMIEVAMHNVIVGVIHRATVKAPPAPNGARNFPCMSALGFGGLIRRDWDGLHGANGGLEFLDVLARLVGDFMPSKHDPKRSQYLAVSPGALVTVQQGETVVVHKAAWN